MGTWCQWEYGIPKLGLELRSGFGALEQLPGTDFQGFLREISGDLKDVLVTQNSPSPYTSGFTQETPLISQEFSKHHKGKVEAGQGTHHLFTEDVPLYGKAHQGMKQKSVGGKGREYLLAQQDRFYPLKNPIFLVTTTEANSVYFVLNDCWKTFQKYCYSQDRKVDFWMLLLFNNLYLNYIFGSSSEKFFIPVRLR